MWPREMENFYFSMFNDQTKLFEKRRHNIVTIKEIRVWNVKRFILKNKESIVYKGDDRNWNF